MRTDAAAPTDVKPTTRPPHPKQRLWQSKLSLIGIRKARMKYSYKQPNLPTQTHYHTPYRLQKRPFCTLKRAVSCLKTTRLTRQKRPYCNMLPVNALRRTRRKGNYFLQTPRQPLPFRAIAKAAPCANSAFCDIKHGKTPQQCRRIRIFLQAKQVAKQPSEP